MNLVNPVHHTGDPASSVEAAEIVTSSGVRESHCKLVLDAMRRHPDSTSGELATHLDGIIDLTEVRRRLTDLKADGLAEQGEVRACRARGTKMAVWRPVEKAASKGREIRTHQVELFR